MPEFARQFEAATVTVERESLVPPELRSRQTDLLIRFDQPDERGYAFVLYEHKSYSDRWVSLQLLRYLIAIWSRERERSVAHTLPPIMPIVLYHGARPWGGPREFSELVGQAVEEHVPRFRPVYLNLSTLSPDQIAGSLRFVLAAIALKYVQQRLEETAARRLIELFHAGGEARETAGLTRLAEQLYVQTRRREDVERLTAIAAESRYTSTEEDLMTYAEELLQEGLEKGIKEGELQDKRNVLMRQLTRRFEMTEAERQLIANSDDPKALDAALDEFATATEKTQVLSNLSL